MYFFFVKKKIKKNGKKKKKEEKVDQMSWRSEIGRMAHKLVKLEKR